MHETYTPSNIALPEKDVQRCLKIEEWALQNNSSLYKECLNNLTIAERLLNPYPRNLYDGCLLVGVFLRCLNIKNECNQYMTKTELRKIRVLFEFEDELFYQEKL